MEGYKWLNVSRPRNKDIIPHPSLLADFNFTNKTDLQLQKAVFYVAKNWTTERVILMTHIYCELSASLFTS